MAYRQMDSKAPSYLEEFLDQIEALPTQIKGKFAEMREMEERSNKFMSDAEKAAADTIGKATTKGTTNEGLKKSYQEVIALQGKALSNNEAKLLAAENAFSEVDQVIRQLDDKLRDFETQLRKEGRWPASTSDKPPRPTAPSAAAVAASAGMSARGTSGAGATQPKSTRRGAAAAAAAAAAASARTASAATAAASAGRTQKAAHKEPEMQMAVIEDMVVDPNEPTYCYCNQISFGEMVMCENDDCPHQWFHFTCVGLTEAPKGQWQCPECKKKEKDRRKSDG